jgi:(1->4)-alpha-D-glucan 1-alpha-D-glucosylmutase
VQLHAGFTFDDAAAIVPYLAELGVSHLYCSPYLQAGKGSKHGYDVVDHTRVNEELGGEPGRRRLIEALRKHGLSQVLDVVPNHMSIDDRRNRWWWDLLKRGGNSCYASYFDIDWSTGDPRTAEPILLPILENHYGRVLEAGLLRIVPTGEGFELNYRNHAVPLSPRSEDDILHEVERRLTVPVPELVTAGGEAIRERPTARQRDALQARTDAISSVLEEINADHDALDALLEKQHYRLAFWRTAGEELDYRRFFDVATLAGMCVENERVFHDTHELVLKWSRELPNIGLRVDHPDGLRDPLRYFNRLQRAAPDAWIVAEKILESNESLPADWPVAGTTGYDFLNLMNQVLLDPDGERPLTDLYEEFTGQPTNYHGVMRDKKHLVLERMFPAEIDRLAELFREVRQSNRRFRDYTPTEVRSVLCETIACFPVYRTYVRADSGDVDEADAACVNEAIAAAKQHRPDCDPDLFDFLRDVLLLKVTGEAEARFVMRFQQHTGPIMAKGIEDTAFYSFNRLVSLNEVGGDPGQFGITLDEFHATCAKMRDEWPTSMLASTTHDTKRSEDVRARIHLLAEIPDHWAATVREWAALNARHRPPGFEDRNIEYLIYQTLVGAWPIDVHRLTRYVEKAAREAKTFTTWTDHNEPYEIALRDSVAALLGDAEFCDRVASFVADLVEPGRINSLAMTLLKLTAPGVPDTYQGTDLWDLSLVDPDNRRPVDYNTRRELLDELPSLTPKQILARNGEGLPKMWVIQQTLALRRERPEAFTTGEYQPLIAQGERAEHVIAFARDGFAITVVPRWPLKLRGQWGDTTLHLPAGQWVNRFTGENYDGTIRLAHMLREYPAAVLAEKV